MPTGCLCSSNQGKGHIAEFSSAPGRKHSSIEYACRLVISERLHSVRKRLPLEVSMLRLKAVHRAVAAILVATLAACGSGGARETQHAATTVTAVTTAVPTPSTVPVNVAPPKSVSLFRMDRVLLEASARPGSWLTFGEKVDPAYPEQSALVFGGAVYYDNDWHEQIRLRTWCKVTKSATSETLVPGSVALIVACDQGAAVPDSSVYVAASPASDPNLVLALHCGVTDFELSGSTLVISSKTPLLSSDASAGAGYQTNPPLSLAWKGTEGFGSTFPDYCEQSFPRATGPNDF